MQDLRAFSAQERYFLVQAAYGKAMLHAHGLERLLGTLLICRATFSLECKTTLDFRITKVKRLPLGKLIEEFVEAFSPGEELIEELGNLLFFRNELAHRVSDIIIDATTQSNWEEDVVKELEDIHSYFVDFKPLLQPYLNTFQAKVGVTEVQMLELIRKVYPGAAGGG
ncbi:MAG: hypothetical protein Q7U84_08190 [Polynucleobacter sp.]|nr:hypothetical protein [Polynucleobacter sp.]